MTITRATVLLTDGTDTVYLHTDKPSALPKISNDALSLMFQAQQNTGAQYVRDNFHIEPAIITIRQGR
jgi:hypothetical protein